MDWLSNHFWLLFGGGGGTLLVALLIYYLQRRQTVRNAEPRGGGTTVSPVASITQYFTPAPAATPAPAVAPTPTTPPQPRARTNIQMTGTRHVMLMEMGNGVMSEDPNGGSEALLIRFTNEPKAGVVGGPVMASLAYETNEPVDERIIGVWLDSTGDVVRFRVDDSHNLLVGFLYERKFLTLGRRQFQGGLKTDVHHLNSARAVRVRLTDANDGHVLYEDRFQITLDPLGLVAART